ncbi:ATP-binding protein [Candidatus Methylospira mobilis]|uniref:ATP-binding protein n=1 Tax=Candidatus Methylospira mobilis TaxID=1808979 RepID=A0A5Q0BF26_9GAMM|nr:ATP-binding protein [Candidatus Methylospira mobilis]QFY42473.1 ATP-binding protein [Candidatus Methylospira mobilis]WNV04420.1 ATP-binding protein [Candidatus Methylospira mobilis]
MTTTKLDALFERAETLIDHLETLLPPPPQAVDWNGALAFKWRGAAHPCKLSGLRISRKLRLEDMRCIDRQKNRLVRNTRQFMQDLPANNALLWGSRGTGKSSLIKALLNEYAGAGLRLIEVDPQHLHELPDILDLLTQRPEKFILYCDDLSFEANDGQYKTLKAVLEGSVAELGRNVLIYATSNRRHLLPEFQSENQQARYLPGNQDQCELHHGDSVEEKISLSERFGLWLSFHPFNQEEYLEIIRYWLQQLGADDTFEQARAGALRFALERGSRSGRVAWQFARDHVGQAALDKIDEAEQS